MNRQGWIKGYYDKYDIHYMRIAGFMGGATCEFEYNGRKYGFTVHPSVKPIKKGSSKKTLDIETDVEAIERELNNIIQYLMLNEEEKKKDKRVEEITEKNYIKFLISNKENCFFDKITTSNSNINKCLYPYVHDGMVSTYFIIRTDDYKDILKESESGLYFSYNPYFATLYFESMITLGYSLYVENTGDECLLFDSNKGIMLVRPGERLKYCKKNILKKDITVPTCYGRDITDKKE
ncbi:MAG: hypothetical protein J6P02_04035 [Lachnospiraceae bacterium]|nr:hypothetical protein [Lachnospiraceae bacterium]